MIASLAVHCVLSVSSDFQAHLEAEFNKKDYAFCHEESFRLNKENHAFCDTLTGSSEVCPKLWQVCQNKPLPNKAVQKGATRKEKARTDISRPPIELGVLGQVLFGILIALFVVGLAWLILKQMSWSKHTPDEPDLEKTPETVVPVSEEAKTDPVETDVQRLLNRAQRAAAQGDFDKAIEDAYAALLRRLEGEGLIDIHPSRTNGDYVRGLSKTPELRQNVKEIVVDVEKVQFGKEAASASRFQSIYERVAPLASKLLFLILIFGMGCELPDNSLTSHSTYGREAFEALLKAAGKRLQKIEEPIAALPTMEDALVLVNPHFDLAQWREILDWVEQNDALLIVFGVDEEFPTSWGIQRKRQPLSAAQSPSEEGSVHVPTEWSLTRERDETEDLLTTPHGLYAFHETTLTDAGLVLFFADDRMLTNLSMASHENAAWLLSLFDEDETIWFYENKAKSPFAENDGQNAPTPFDSVRNANMTVLMLHVLAFSLIYIVARGVFFGTPRGSREKVQRAFSEHVRALGLAYERAGASAHVTRLYVSWAMDRLLESRPGGKAGLSQLASAIASRTGQSEAEVEAFLEKASMLKRQEPVEGESPDFTVVKTLETYLSAMGLGHAHRATTPKT